MCPIFLTGTGIKQSFEIISDTECDEIRTLDT